MCTDLAVDASATPVEERHPLGWTDLVLRSVRARLRAVTPVVLHRVRGRGCYRPEYLGKRYRVERSSPRDLWEVWVDDESHHGAGLLLGLTWNLPGAREVVGLHGSGECMDLAELLRRAIRMPRRGVGRNARPACRQVEVTLDEVTSGWLGA